MLSLLTMSEAAPSLAAPEPRRFGASARAFQQRRLLLRALKLLLLSCLLILAWRFQPPSLAFNAVKWALVGGLAWGLWRAQGVALLQRLAERELSLHANALELKRGDFKRFVVFESLRHIRVVQAPRGERLISIRLDTDEDSLLLRDLEGLPEAFAAIAGAKPDKALIEIEEHKVDWGEPLPWALAIGGALLLLGWLIAGALDTPALFSASGKLMLLNGLALGLWRPLGRGQAWPVVSGEAGSLLVLALLGYYLS